MIISNAAIVAVDKVVIIKFELRYIEYSGFVFEDNCIMVCCLDFVTLELAEAKFEVIKLLIFMPTKSMVKYLVSKQEFISDSSVKAKVLLANSVSRQMAKFSEVVFVIFSNLHFQQLHLELLQLNSRLISLEFFLELII